MEGSELFEQAYVRITNKFNYYA